jgi:hypothetical protein
VDGHPDGFAPQPVHHRLRFLDHQPACSVPGLMETIKPG